ncbi:Ig-like domain-containing protein [Desulfobacula sp.]|uniref:Ig-like domain-containing protein n=1 Tax=Desulfobacula sp. TaxID=2593537 RepID=UPI0026375C6F|nr:Ig-like domain-containing protein [Desulfobacula sp.]
MTTRSLLFAIVVGAALVMTLFQPVFADAVLARTQINAVCEEIDTRVAEIKSLKHAKNLQQAFDKLEDLNTYIENNLQNTFYDKIQVVRREDPTYTPPQIQIDLGVEFTTEYWDGRIEQATKSLKDATGALKGIPAMKTLDFHNKTFVVLKALKNTFSNVKSVVEDVASLNLVGLTKDTWEALNGFIDDYTAIEDANLQAVNTNLFKMEIETLIRKAKKTLELMRDAKSSYLKYRYDIALFDCHLRNIAHYTDSAVKNPVWPLDFNNQDYTFNPEPYKEALDRLSANFLAEEFCWSQFVKIYSGIMAEALEEKNQVVENINTSPEPQENKTGYLNDVTANWGWLSDHAQNMWDEFDTARLVAWNTYDTLSDAVDGLETQIMALESSYWDTQGFVRESLDTFDEAFNGIIQTNLPSFSGNNPYYLMREYDPTFPLSELRASFEMPDTTPDINDYSFRTYPDALNRLAGAYLTMGQAGLTTDSTRTYSGSGNPVAQFAASPLSQPLMDAVGSNLDVLATQVDHYETFMASKHDILMEIENTRTAWEIAVEALASHADDNWISLCTRGDTIRGNAEIFWDAIHLDVVLADADSDFSATLARRKIDSAVEYIDGQAAFNQDLAISGVLLQRLQNDQTLRTLVQFIIGDYTVLPAMPSEQGYLDFLKQLEYLAAFYNLSDLERVMDLRAEAKALFQQVFAEASSLNSWINRDNPYCVMPENLDVFNALIDAVGLYSDLYVQDALDGFPGWAAGARKTLNTYWPVTSGDDIRPNVIHHTPGMNSENVSVYQTIRVGFNEPMDEATLVSPFVTLKANGVEKSYQDRYDTASRTLFVTPGHLLPDTTYTLTLNEGCTDLAGNALVEESWSFTTESFDLGTQPVVIDITGVADGGTYAEPVTIGIQVSSGGYQATVWRDGQSPQPVIDGAVVSARGRYDLQVETPQGNRRLSFIMGIPLEDAAMDVANEYAAPTRPRSVVSDEYLGIGLRYLVEGTHYYYSSGGKVYRFDMLTGQDIYLFDADDYYTTIGGINGAPSTRCSFLDVAEPWVLYVKNTGIEGPGVDPADKTFSLFLYNTDTQASTAVPTGSASITSGLIHRETVVWLDSTGAAPVIRSWKIGASQPLVLHTITGLEYWQKPLIQGFTGDHLVFEISDGENYTAIDTDGVNGVDYREPKGESLHVLDTRTGNVSDLVSHDPQAPVRIHNAATVQGRAVALVYAMHGNVVGNFWNDTCDDSKLRVFHLDSQAVFTVSTKPQVWHFQISESLVYYMERNNAPPYSLSGIQLTSDMTPTAYDLFTHRTYPVDLGAASGHFALFGDSLISDDDTPRVVALGPSTSSVSISNTQPADGTLDVPVSTRITAVFSDDMNPDTLTSEWIALTRLDKDKNFIARDPVVMSYDAATRTLSLDPGILASGADYRVTISGNVQDAGGAVLGASYYWGFTTQDVDGPTLVNSVPASNTTVLPQGGRIQLIFDDLIDSDSIVGNVLLNKGSSPIDFTFSGGGSHTVSLMPVSPLDPGTTYTIAINTGITDMAGNTLTHPVTLSFTTVSHAPLSVNGKLITADQMMGGIYETALPGGSSEQLDGSYVQDVVASPDGAYLYFMSGNLQVWNRQTQVISASENDFLYRFTPDFLPDGSRIIYARNRSGLAGTEIISNSLAGDNPQVIVAVPDGTVTSVAVSPSGTQIAFAVNMGFSKPPEVRVFTLATQQMAVYIGGDIPHWSPSGDKIYAFANSADTAFEWAVVSLLPDLSSATFIARVDGASSSAVSPTGRFLTYFSNNGLSVVSLSSGSQVDVLACTPANMGTVRLFWTSDETHVLIPAMGVESQNTIGAYAVNIANRSVSTMTSIDGGMPAMPMDFLENPGSASPDPVAIQVTNISSGNAASVTLDWSSYADTAAASFRVYTSDHPFFTVNGMTPIATLTGKTYADTSLNFGVAAYYAVTPVLAGGTESILVEPFGPVSVDDQDGLNDAWEYLYFSSLDQTADDDPDNDTLTNAQEAVKGTNPTMADTDGDLAPDGVEVDLGMDPNVKDVMPIVLTAPGADVAVDQIMTLSTSGGSGSYSYTVNDTRVATVGSQGQVTGVSKGTVTLTAQDTLFPTLVSNDVNINVVSESFDIRPSGPYTLQKNGYLDLTVAGGSGFYTWTLLKTDAATLTQSGAGCRLASTGTEGTVTIRISDELVPERETLTVTIIVASIPGDLNGDSRVMLDDAILCNRVMTHGQPSSTVNMDGDTNNNGQAEMMDVLYILKAIR